MPSYICYFTIHAHDEEVMLGQQQELLSHLKVSIHEICHVCIPSARQPIGYLECPLEHDKSHGPHVQLDSITTSSDISCSKSECQNVPKEAYMLLLTTLSDKGKLCIFSKG